MKKLLIGLVLLGSYVFAEPMPEGSDQYRLAQQIVSAAMGYTVECESAYKSDTLFQWICGFASGDIESLRLLIDLELSDYEVIQAWSRVNARSFVKRVDFDGRDLVISLIPEGSEYFMLIGLSNE
jgi:hypothetical protein